MHDLHDIDFENFREKKALEKEREDCGYRDRGYDPEDDDFEFDSPRTMRQRRDYRYALLYTRLLSCGIYFKFLPIFKSKQRSVGVLRERP